MVYQNNSNAWVVLAVIAILLCGGVGLLLGIGVFGPGLGVHFAVEATSGAIDAQATQGAYFAVQTPQAAFARQTAVSAELSAVPMVQTATQIALVAAVGNARATATQSALDDSRQAGMAASQATQTAVARQVILGDLAFRATATAMARGPLERAADDGSLLVFAAFGSIAVVLGVAARLWTQATRARAQEKIAEAHLVMAEQRRLRASQTLRQTHYAHTETAKPIPASLINKSGSGRDLPRAE